jgi:hypothetical protein
MNNERRVNRNIFCRRVAALFYLGQPVMYMVLYLLLPMELVFYKGISAELYTDELRRIWECVLVACL